MKTLVKNRRTYRNRIGTLVDDHVTMKREESDNDNDEEGNNTDSWDDMYQADKERDFGIDKGGNGEDGDENKGADGKDSIDEDDNVEDGDENKGADNEDEDANLDISGSRDGGANEGVNEDGDRNNRKESNGGRGVSGRKDDEGRDGMKRKNRDDGPVTRAKRSKPNVSGGHQVATQPTKKIQQKKSGKSRIDD